MSGVDSSQQQHERAVRVSVVYPRPSRPKALDSQYSVHWSSKSTIFLALKMRRRRHLHFLYPHAQSPASAALALIIVVADLKSRQQLALRRQQLVRVATFGNVFDMLR